MQAESKKKTEHKEKSEKQLERCVCKHFSLQHYIKEQQQCIAAATACCIYFYCVLNGIKIAVVDNMHCSGFALIICLIDARQHSCSYQVPSIEQVQLNVPLSLYHHDADEDQQKEAKEIDQVRRDFVADREFRPLRIFLYYDPVSIEPLDVDKQIFINSSLLPLAVDFWKEALLVRPSKAPIRLSRRCKSNHYYLDALDSHPSCVDQCKTITTCGEVSIPDEHLFQCRYCALPNPLACTSSGRLFLFCASFPLNSRLSQVQNEDTIAYAAHCQQEAELDRPIAGHVNVCPTSLSTHQHDQEILLSTIKHEILHALGFSAGLYAFFRDSNGQPRTKRNRYNRPISFNRDRGYYDADDSTILTKMRTDWWTAENRIPHPVHLMVTEKVVEEARKHFGCEALEGLSWRTRAEMALH
uniref:Leishmanolysin-like peptidase n=1 Tax=Ditylenchus dipsaci TaxID=166011 RepID=A0A915CUM6_9BILA